MIPTSVDSSDAARIEMWGGGAVANAASMIAIANDISLSVSEPTAGPGLYDGRIAINATEGRIHHSENVTVDSDSTVALDGGNDVTLTATNDITVTANGGILTLAPATQTNSETEIYKSSGGTAEGWNTLTLLNSWANRGAGYPQLAYRRVASPPNSLQLVGVCAGPAGSYGGGTQIAQLPVGYRPAVSTSFPVGGAVASDATSTPTMQVDTSGYLRVWYHAFGRYTEFAVTIPLDAS